MALKSPLNHRLWRDASIAARTPAAHGPWKPDGWPARYHGDPPYNLPSWRHFRRFSTIRLEITELMERTTILVDSMGSDPDPPSLENRYDYLYSYHFLAEVAIADLWRGPVVDRPPEMSAHYHNSATAFGSGLYDCAGYFHLLGEATIRNYTLLTITEEGEAPEVIGPTDETDVTDSYRALSYESDHTAINGLLTPCGLLAESSAYGPGVAFYPDYTGGPPGVVVPFDPDAEDYFTGTFLARLAEGSWDHYIGGGPGGITQSRTGSAGLSEGGYEVGNHWSDTWTRTGHLSLTLT